MQQGQSARNRPPFSVTQRENAVIPMAFLFRDRMFAPIVRFEEQKTARKIGLQGGLVHDQV
jgi:hypothetical protein